MIYYGVWCHDPKSPKVIPDQWCVMAGVPFPDTSLFKVIFDSFGHPGGFTTDINAAFRYRDRMHLLYKQYNYIVKEFKIMYNMGFVS